MTTGVLRTVVVALAAVAVAMGAGSATATRPQAGPLEAAAAYIGVTVAQLRNELRQGKSLAQVAGSHGKSVEGLEEALVADAKARLERRVAAGRLSAERAAKILERFAARLDRLVQRTGVRANGLALRPLQRAAFVRAVRATAAYTGLTRVQVRAQLRDGKSLAQVAEGAGKSVQGLKETILAAVKAAIDKRVAAGKLTAQRGERLYEAFAARVDRLLNRTRAAG